MSILECFLHLDDFLKNLGVWFDAEISFSEHVKQSCKACFLQTRDLRRIRQHLTPEVAVLAANGSVSSRLDYLTLCLEVCHVSISTNCRVLSQIIESMIMLHPS